MKKKNDKSKKERSRLIVLYATFAVAATIVNILTQKLSFLVYNQQFAIYVALVLGTGTGLLTKYVLDKKYIFKYKVNSLSGDVKTFALYAVMGIITTVIFWGFELSFDALFSHPEAKFLGGIIGLTIGYTTKYFLDRKFVFVKGGK